VTPPVLVLPDGVDTATEAGKEGAGEAFEVPGVGEVEMVTMNCSPLVMGIDESN
jgi:hypothetical protein